MATKTPISLLQEYSVAQKLSLPKYTEMGDLVDDGRFACFCDLNQIYQAIGFGTTKKSAKHDSAQKVLDLLLKDKPTIIDNEILSTNETMNNLGIQKNYVGILNEFASKHQLSYPKYNIINQCTLINNNFITECIFNKFQTNGCGLNKKDSKQEAAKNMLQIVQNCNEFECITVNKTEKWQMDDHDFKKITELYKKLSLNLNEQSTEKTLDNHNLESVSDIQICDSIEELENELKNYNILYDLNELQKEPWIMVFQVVNTKFTLLGCGETKKDAIRDVLKTAVKIKKKGFAFRNASLE